MIYYSIVIWFVGFLVNPQIADACNGYVLKFHYLKHCNDTNVIQVSNLTSVLDKDCNIIPNGCISVQDFNTAVMRFKAEKIPLPPLENEVDVCQLLEEKNEYALLAAGALGFPQKCPVKKSQFCLNGDKKVNISKYKSKLGITLGVSTVNMFFKHDTGTTCLIMKVEFSKPRRRG